MRRLSKDRGSGTQPLGPLEVAVMEILWERGESNVREVAERLTAGPGTRDYGYLTIATQIYSQPQIALAVPPGAFSPAPKVQSALVTFRMKAKFDRWPQATCDKFLEFVKRCFAQKRKNLLNNLRGVYPRSRIVQAFEEVGKPANLRAEQLSLEELAGVFERLARCRQG